MDKYSWNAKGTTSEINDNKEDSNDFQISNSGLNDTSAKKALHDH